MTNLIHFSIQKTQSWLCAIAPGFLVAVVIALAAKFLSEHYGTPSMLLALLLGMAFHFLSEDGNCVQGVEFTSRIILRIGVALLGARISIELLLELGPELIFLVFAGLILTILFGLLGSYFLGRGWKFALLTGGAVAICGASAAMAIAAVLPKNEHSERNLIFTILAVTVLSTFAMIVYPIVADFLGLDDLAIGVFLGGTIHDVAQVVGAGFSVSEQTGETATLVKLFRVAMLAPVVLVLSFIVRSTNETQQIGGAKPPILPFFVICFLALAAINSFHLLPKQIGLLFNELSRWSLLISIAAVGIKTSLKTILGVGRQAILLIIAETVFIAAFVLAGVKYLGV